MTTFNKDSASVDVPAMRDAGEDEMPDEMDATSAVESSEVARRINLLGKLIIPPSSPTI